MIEVKNVTKKYGKVVAVDKISFTINDGEIIGLLGPNGAGKSTTMNMITGYIEPTEGEISIEGYDISKKSKKAKAQIGYMPEGVPLYSDLTVKEFVTYMAELKKVDRKTRKEKVEKIIEQTGLKEVEKKLTRNLSRGYKQRVSMAGALVGEPKILILDEPTVGLDPKQITEIRALIKELGKTHTIILSSHILSEVSQICNKVIIINKGKIVAIDTPENLEKKVSTNNATYVTVEDTENKIETIKDKLTNVKEIKLITENEDKTKKYMITADSDVDLRKNVFETFAKEGITIFEMKKSDATLEDAFMQLIDTKKEDESSVKSKVEVNEDQVEELEKEVKENKSSEETTVKETAEEDSEKDNTKENDEEEKKETEKEEKGGQE